MPESGQRRGIPRVNTPGALSPGMDRDAQYWIRTLELERHPEGGYFRRTYKSKTLILEGAHPGGHTGPRAVLSCIHYLLIRGDFSAFHRLASWEAWHFHDGDRLLLHILLPDGRLETRPMGRTPEAGETRIEVIEPGCWFAAELAEGGSFALIGCTVAPGFEFEDFQLADGERLAADFPRHRDLIGRLTRTLPN